MRRRLKQKSAGSFFAGTNFYELRALFWLRHLEFRVFVRPGPTGEQVKAVANALGADLVVTSSDYHRRFLSCLTDAETGILRVQGVACPVVVVNAVVMEPLGRTRSFAQLVPGVAFGQAGQTTLQPLSS